MLYGIRRDLQAALVKEGYRVRVYVPFGKQWYPYFMRRLGERPANVGVRVEGNSQRSRLSYLPSLRALHVAETATLVN